MLVVNAKSQDFLHEDDYDKKTKQGIVLVEFWASFNSVNEVNLKKIYDCKKYRVDMSQDPSLMAKHSVMAVPTVVIYHNGKEVKRFQADISFAMKATEGDVQEVVDEIIMDQF